MNTTPNSFGARLKGDLKNGFRQAKKHRAHYLFVLPYAILYAVFMILPVAIAIFLGFTSFNMLESPQAVGFQNFFRLFLNDEIFITALKNTLVFAVIIGPLGYIMAFMFAWLINELSHGMRVLFTIIFYAPSVSGGMYVVWTYLFSSDQQGYVNSLLFRLGITQEAILFFQDERFMAPLVIVVSLWMSLGTTFLVFIAGFQGLDTRYYEAAAIDGIRNRWQELWYITLPMMKPQLLLNAVLSITSAFTVGDICTALCGFPSTNYAVHTIMNHIQDYGFTRYEMGYACAIATFLFALMVLCNMAVNKLLKGIGT